jgi:hypothetical protein
MWYSRTYFKYFSRGFDSLHTQVSRTNCRICEKTGLSGVRDQHHRDNMCPDGSLQDWDSARPTVFPYPVNHLSPMILTHACIAHHTGASEKASTVAIVNNDPNFRFVKNLIQELKVYRLNVFPYVYRLAVNMNE